MAKDMSCARVKQCSAASIGATERHNERLNTDYANVNVVQERIPLNVHYRSPPSSYMETLRTMEAAGTVSTRGLRKDATLFDEIIIDVNTTVIFIPERKYRSKTTGIDRLESVAWMH